MRNRKLGLALLMIAGMVLPVATPAGASPGNAGQCIACHTVDPNVVVSASFERCAGAAAIYSATVSNPYGTAGYGLFRLSNSSKLRYGYGTLATFSVASNTGFSFQGVSANTSTLASGANSVEFTTPNCQITCIDADGDGYSGVNGGCGLWDCNEADPAINPGANEIWFDGIDQNCNGYDLTIAITKAEWSRKTKRLTVEATSSLGADANLHLAVYYDSITVPYGQMTSRQRGELWVKRVTTSASPRQVSVYGPEGSWYAPVTIVP